MRKWYYVLCIVLLSVLLPISVNAQSLDSTLHQEIRLIDCTATTTNNGGSGTVSTDCEGVIAPTISPLVTTEAQPVINGTFDAATVQTFRVTIDKRTYQLNQHMALTKNGNFWQLDLGKTDQKLSPGTYNVIAEVTTDDSILVRDGSLREVTILSINGGGDPQDPGTSPVPGAPNTGFRQVAYTIIFVSAALLAVLLFLILFRWRLRRNDK